MKFDPTFVSSWTVVCCNLVYHKDPARFDELAKRDDSKLYCDIIDHVIEQYNEEPPPEEVAVVYATIRGFIHGRHVMNPDHPSLVVADQPFGHA